VRGYGGALGVVGSLFWGFRGLIVGFVWFCHPPVYIILEEISKMGFN
jgi:hypothetical protein